jgi:hypothetical protein
MIALAIFGLTLWIADAVIYVNNDLESRRVYHLWERVVSEDFDTTFDTSHPAPYWPRLYARLSGRPWPGDFVCNQCNLSYESFARRVGTKFGPDRSFFTDRVGSSEDKLPPHPHDVLRVEYLARKKTRFGPTHTVVIAADVKDLDRKDTVEAEGQAVVIVPSRITYVIKDLNTGPEAVAGVAISVMLPDNVTPMSISAPGRGPQFDGPKHTLIFPPIDRLAPGSRADHEILVRVDRPGAATCHVSLGSSGRDTSALSTRPEPQK